jgi:hypothetical protein
MLILQHGVWHGRHWNTHASCLKTLNGTKSYVSVWEEEKEEMNAKDEMNKESEKKDWRGKRSSFNMARPRFQTSKGLASLLWR